MDEGSEMRPSFWTFNIGHVLTLITFLVAGFSAYYGLKTDLTVVDVRIGIMERTVSQLATVVIENTRQEERLKFLEQRVQWLEITMKK